MLRLLSPKLREQVDVVDGVTTRSLLYWCQGCQETHRIYVEGQKVPIWSWNGDADRPVFGPSVLYQTTKHVPPVTPENLAQWRETPWDQKRVDWVCHTFIGCNGAQPGEVIFLSDCTHALAGTVQPFPELPESMRGDK